MKLAYKVMIGDSEETLKKIESSSIHLTITSPPYYVMRGEVAWDSYEGYLEKMKAIFRGVYHATALHRYCVVNICEHYIHEGKTYPIGADICSLMNNELKWKYAEDIIWVKPSGATGMKRGGTVLQNPYPMYFFPDNRYEHNYVFTKGSAKYDYDMHKLYASKQREMSRIDANNMREFLGDVWYIQTDQDKMHKAIFPLKLPENFIKFYSFVGENVLDPFLGSGTTMLAAKNLHRSCIGLELEDRYIDTIMKKVGWNQTNLMFPTEYKIEKMSGSVTEEIILQQQ